MSTACFDFGNTRLKAAVFSENKLSEVCVFTQENLAAQIKSFLSARKIENSILSSVIDHSAEVESVLAAGTRYHKLSASSILPFTIPVGKPETVGADRLAIAAAAVDLYPRQNTLVIALG